MLVFAYKHLFELMVPHLNQICPPVKEICSFWDMAFCLFSDSEHVGQSYVQLCFNNQLYTFHDYEGVIVPLSSAPLLIITGEWGNVGWRRPQNVALTHFGITDTVIKVVTLVMLFEQYCQGLLCSSTFFFFFVVIIIAKLSF